MKNLGLRQRYGHLIAALLSTSILSACAALPPDEAVELAASAPQDQPRETPRRPPSPPRQGEIVINPLALALPGEDELFTFGDLPDDQIDIAFAGIKELGVRTVVLDSWLWTKYPTQCKKLSEKLQREGIGIVLHVLIHPSGHGAIENPANDIANVAKWYRELGASGLYDDGVGGEKPQRSDAELNARLYPEIKAVIDALPWAPTYFATANNLQVHRGDRRLIKSIGYTDFYRDDPGWGKFSKEFWKQLEGAVQMTNEARAKYPRHVAPMLGWVRWHPDWADPQKQREQIAGVIDAARRNNFAISWQLGLHELPKLTAESQQLFKDRAAYMAERAKSPK